MKAPAFEYLRPKSLDEAVAELARGAGEARLIAGGQSLMPMLNLRIAAPSLLIDIARLPELVMLGEDADDVTLGAGITHAMIEDGRVPDPSRGLMPQVAAGLAYRAIRNRGTIGGSLALADPAAEWPAVLTALGAELRLRGPNGQRTVKCAEFVTGVFATALGEDEIVEQLRIPKLPPGARWGYVKLCRKSGEFANALAVAVAEPAQCHARVVLGAAEGAPLVLEGASRALAEGRSDPGAIAADLDRAADRPFDRFQRRLHIAAATRAAQQATA